MLHGNTALSGGALCLEQGRVAFDGSTTFSNNSVEENGGAIIAVGAIIDAREVIEFTSNTAQNGGAVYMRSESFVIVGSDTVLSSSFNKALDYGGGIYHVDKPALTQCSYDENAHYPEQLHCCTACCKPIQHFNGL